MIELQRHIEILLLSNECVIVPDFGGFMTHEVAARYDEADHSFIPPYRTLGFNPQLRLNDSVLAQSYVETYDISYPEALRRIEHEVNMVKQQLSEEGSFELENLGLLTVNQEGNYEFAPCEAGVLSPALYGLSDFTFMRLKDDYSSVKSAKTLPASVSKADEATGTAFETKMLDILGNNQNDKEESAVVIKMSWIRNAVAVAAAVVAFFLIATPITNSNLNTQAMSQLQHHLLYKLIPQDTNVATVEPVVAATPEVVEKPHAEQQAEKADVKASVPVKEEKTVAPVTKNAPTYYIVVASQVKMANAESYVEQLHKEGYQDAKILVRSNIVRVVCGSFTNMNDAYRQLNKMNVKEEFYEAWVFKDTSAV